MKKRRLKKSVKIYGLISLIALIIIISLSLYLNKVSSISYKLKEHGYNKEDIKVISKLNKEETKKILSIEYDANLSLFLKEKYFISNKLEAYLSYLKENKIDIKDVIEIINTGSDKTVYTDIKDTDTSKNELMLVNKYYSLNKYVPEDLVNIKTLYAYQGNQITKEANTKLEEMFIAAKKEGFTLIVKNSYRSYEKQESIYNALKVNKGLSYADKVSARPGHSEHQTGLVIDIEDYKNRSKNFSDTEAYLWIKDNSYKYGFIERYPDNKTLITGFEPESYHYRYVGLEAAKEIYRNEITFDLYYSYYVDK